MESYRDSEFCQQCMLQRRRRFKSVSESKHKQIRLSNFCAVSSIVISLMAFGMCFRLQTAGVMNEDITQLHSMIEELTREINILKYNQSKGNYMLINQKVKNDKILHDNRKTPAKHKKPNSVQRFEEVSSLLEADTNRTKSSPNETHRIVKRSRKNRGKKKTGLPFIQIEGAGTQVHQTDKNAVTGYWTLPGWLANKNKRVKAARKGFKFSDLNNSGKLRVKKTGVYLVYAQFTLVGNPITGFHVSLAHSSFNTKKILQCTQFVESKTSDYRQPTQSCFTMGIMEIEKDQEIFIQENEENSGANYSNVSYFGLVRIGD